MEPFAALRVCLRSKVDPKSPAGWCGSDTDDGKVWRSEALELEASSRSRPVLGDVPIFFNIAILQMNPLTIQEPDSASAQQGSQSQEI